MRLDIYMNYRGNCEQAFRFYEEHLGGANRISSLPGTQAQNPYWSDARRRCPVSRVGPGAVESEHADAKKTTNVKAVLTMRAGQFRSRMVILRKQEACLMDHGTPGDTKSSIRHLT